MSGGHFDYKCSQISYFAEELKHELEINDNEETGHHYNSETIAVLHQCQALIENSSAHPGSRRLS